MGTSAGMRGKDLQKFLMVARDFNVILLVRHTNENSLKYIGERGFYPKPAIVKAKTADTDNPPANLRNAYRIAGLVVHPGFQPNCFGDGKADKAEYCWRETMLALTPQLAYVKVDLKNPASWAVWGKEHTAVKSSRWRWRIDIDPKSPRFGCLQLKSNSMDWCYVHGDYDLKDVIVLGRESENQRIEGTVDGVPNFTPRLHELEFDKIRQVLNARMGVEMVQHGSEAQFAWHGDEPITVAYPDWNHLILGNAEAVLGWYEDFERDVITKRGARRPDYRRDPRRTFFSGPEGTHQPLRPPVRS